MSGLEIEACEIKDFPANLTEGEVHHALRYLVWELNGFPGWLEQVYKAYPKVLLEAVLAELHWELARTKLDKSPHYILQDLVYHAAWMHQSLAPSLLAWLEQNEILNQDALRDCIHILQCGDANVETVSRLAQAKITANTAKEQRVAWYALWIDFDAGQAIPVAEQWLSNLPVQEASEQAQQLITELMGTRRPFNAGHGRGNFRIVKHLKVLYVLMHQHIRAQDDTERAGQGVYTRELRDDAQKGRDTLLSWLV